MADGKTHAAYASKAAIAITLASGVAAVAVHPVFMAAPVGAWVACVVDPDLDHHAFTVSEQSIWRINPVIGWLGSLYWWPYEAMSKHRGRSHTIPQGTLDRFLLVFWPIILLSLSAVPAVGPWVVVAWALVFVGQMAVDAVHLWLDGLV